MRFVTFILVGLFLLGAVTCASAEDGGMGAVAVMMSFGMFDHTPAVTAPLTDLVDVSKGREKLSTSVSVAVTQAVTASNWTLQVSEVTTTSVWPVEIPTSVDPEWAQSVANDPVSTDSELTTTETSEVSEVEQEPDSPQAVLETFISANEVFAGGEIVPTQYAKGLYSHPKAVVLQCAESMPDPHVIFGQPLGRIAVVRNMANTLPIAGLQPDSLDTASVEYPVLNQGAKLIIVLGHTDCSVMQTVVTKWNEIKGKAQVTPGSQTRANLGALYQVLYPAVTMADRDGESDLLDASIRKNVTNTVAGLVGDTYAFSKLVESGELVIVGAVYNPDTRRVEFLEQ